MSSGLEAPSIDKVFRYLDDIGQGDSHSDTFEGKRESGFFLVSDKCK